MINYLLKQWTFLLLLPLIPVVLLYVFFDSQNF
jgi:hypothetical protein